MFLVSFILALCKVQTACFNMVAREFEGKARFDLKMPGRSRPECTKYRIFMHIKVTDFSLIKFNLIIGQNFIWMHFPKCAGSFTENLLKKYFLEDPHISFDKIDPSNVIWHQNIARREQTTNVDLSGKSVICNFRRLPHWIVSRINFEASRSGITVPREMYTEGRFYEMNGNESFADKYVARFTERKVDHWIRVEYMQEDFFQAFSNYLDVRTLVKPSDFKETINVSAGVSGLDSWFNEKDLALLYASNPKWAEVEKELYGNLLNEI